MMLEVYYEHYREYARKPYWELDQRVLPFGVKCDSMSEKELLVQKLRRHGFKSVGNAAEQLVVLVNLQLSRYASPFYACKHATVEDKLLTLSEFSVILDHWIRQQTNERSSGK